MKLAHLQEAKYATPSTHFTQWAKKQIASGAEFVTHPLEDRNDVREAVDDLSNGFGKPEHEDDVTGTKDGYEYWMWEQRIDDEHVYLIVVNTSPELFVEFVVK